ncbi:uncharacterized protein, partial [Temnothorax nylanderi]|uniref:uncharacterized protein n=1 Tax=Temnothorax nylanderi TaxID=102681 RepID=UPI003A8C5620
KIVSSLLYKRKINVLISVYSKHTCRHGLFDSSKCSSNEGRYYSDIYSRSCHHSIQRFTTDKPKVENKTLISLQRYWKSAIRNFHLSYFQTDADVTYRRKLLSYEQNFFGTRPTRSSRFHNGIREVILAEATGLTERKRNVAAKDIESNDEDIDSAAWDNWSIWSTCSVTCGQGRQVRWRHCLSADCIEGLKKAQLKRCRLKDCAFKEAISEIDKVSSNITPTVVESDIDTLKIKLDKLNSKNYDVFRDIDGDDEEEDNIRPQIKREKNSREPKIWDQWGNWSTCSVTCGIGKIMRWRHCIGGRCSLGEKKAQLKTCTSAAC